MFIKKRTPHDAGARQDGAPAPEMAPRVQEEVIEVQATEAAPAPRLGGLGKFAKSKPAAATAAAVEAPKKGFFGRKASAKPAGDEASDAKVATGKKAKKAAAPKAVRAGAPRDAVDVLVELEDDKRVAWRVTAHSIEEVPLEQVARAASFSAKERRFPADGTLSFEQAQNLALAEIGEEVRIVNGSKLTHAVYASTAERIASLGAVETGPGLFLVEQLLAGERQSGEEVVVCLVLTGAQESRSLAVLYHFTKSDEVAATQITVNPDNLNFVLSQFAVSRRMDSDSTRFVLFRNEDLLKVAGKLAYYPSEAMWHGMSLRRVVWTMAMVAGGAAAAAGLFAGQAYASKAMTQRNLSAAQTQKTKALKDIDVLIGSSVTSFSKTQGMSLDAVTKRAGKLWFPGSRVVLDSTPAKESYSVQMPLTRGAQVGNNPSVLNKATLSEVEPLLNVQPPEGCSKDVPQVSGGMNAIQVVVTCENPAGPLASYRLN